MAQPPAVVTRTFKPAGQLRLHQLSKRASFRCVRCGRDRIASLVATVGGDWTQTVCISCYGSQVVTERDTKKAKQPPAPVTPQPSKKVRAGQPKDKPPQPIPKKLKRRLPGIDGLLAFYRAAHVRAELGRNGRLWINGYQIKPLTHLPPPDTIEWERAVDEITLKYVGNKFIKAVENNARFGEGLRAFLRRREMGFAIMRGDVRLAIIHATHAQIPHRNVIHGNFLKPGPHWQQVADVLHDAEPQVVAEWKHEQEAKAVAKAAAAAKAKLKVAAKAVSATEVKPSRAAARRHIDHLPNDLSPELTHACLDASRRIRLERQVAYERPVVLECDFGELTLMPIAGTGSRLLVPFRLNKGVETLKGELVLGDLDPLELLIGEDVADGDAIKAWTCVLLGFADATCIDLEPVEAAVRREPRRPRWRPSSSVSHRPPSARTVPRRRPWPKHLEPVGQWIRYSGSFVAGHRRRLNDDQEASAEARDRARQVGIILHSHETWVRPHTRGVPDGIDMRFLWHTPTELDLFRA